MSKEYRNHWEIEEALSKLQSLESILEDADNELYEANITEKTFIALGNAREELIEIEKLLSKWRTK